MAEKKSGAGKPDNPNSERKKEQKIKEVENLRSEAKIGKIKLSWDLDDTDVDFLEILGKYKKDTHFWSFGRFSRIIRSLELPVEPLAPIQIKVQLVLKNGLRSNGVTIDTAALHKNVVFDNVEGRELLIYLPDDYEKENKKYPVIYMHDGQNLFSERLAFLWDWRVDEALDRLTSAGQMEKTVVVGIYNSSRRAEEYTPFADRRFGGGKAREFSQFVVEKIIPYILISTFISFLDEETRKNYESAKNKIRLFFYSLAPMGLFIVLSYYISPWLLPLMILLLFALRQAIMLGIREIEIVNQEELIKKLNSVSRTLKIVEEQNKDLELDLNKKIDEQNILMELGEALGTSVNLEGTLEIVVSMIRKLVVYQSCVIFLIDQGQLVAAKSVTPYRDMLEYSSLLKLEETIVNLVVQNKKAIIIPDMQAMGEQRIFKNERSLICIPLIVKNEIIGVIYVGATHPGTYNEDHLHLLSILGNAASNAIRTAQLYKQLEQAFVGQKNLNAQLDSRVQAFEMLLEVGQKLGSSLNLDEAQKVIIDGLDAMFNYQSAAIFLIKMGIKGAVFAPTKFRSPYEKYFENLQIAFDDQSNVMGWVAHYRKPLLLTDTRDTRLQTVLEKERSIMVVPMIVESEITGALYVGHSNPNFFNEEALSLLEAVAHNSAMAIKHAEIYERTARRAITDGLTGLYSHRYFQERLLEEINHARRRHIGLALLMIDADHFKTLNDTLGHPEGDLCLKTLAEIMKQHTRDSDVLCRIGGDEFTILLKEIDKKNAIIKAEAIRQGVQAKFYDARVQITTSIGIACFPEDADNTKDLIAAADAALYKSKKLGRNRVSVA